MKLSSRRSSVRRLVRMTLGLDVILFVLMANFFVVRTMVTFGTINPTSAILLVVGVALLPGLVMAAISDKLPPLRPVVWPTAVAFSLASLLSWVYYSVVNQEWYPNQDVFLAALAFYLVGTVAAMAAHVLDGGRPPTNLDRLCGGSHR